MRDELETTFDPRFQAVAEVRRMVGARLQRQAASRPRITRSVFPREPIARPVDPAAQSALQADAAYQLAADKFSTARARWWTVITTGSRIAIDKAAAELAAAQSACVGAAYQVAIRKLRNDLDSKAAYIESLQADRDRAMDEARESRQAQPPLRVELALPSQIPDLNVNMRPSAGVEIERDKQGNIIGTRPRGPSSKTKPEPLSPNTLKAKQSQDNLEPG